MLTLMHSVRQHSSIKSQSPHHCPLLVGEVDSDGAPTSGYILRAGLPRGGVGGGGGHDERAEERGGHAARRHTHDLRSASCTEEPGRVKLGPSVLQPHGHISERMTRDEEEEK